MDPKGLHSKECEICACYIVCKLRGVHTTDKYGVLHAHKTSAKNHIRGIYIFLRSCLNVMAQNIHNYSCSDAFAEGMLNETVTMKNIIFTRQSIIHLSVDVLSPCASVRDSAQ